MNKGTILLSTNSNLDMTAIARELATFFSLEAKECFTWASILGALRLVLTAKGDIFIPNPNAVNILFILVARMSGKSVVGGIHDAIGHDKEDTIKVFLYNTFLSRFCYSIIFYSEFSRTQFQEKYEFSGNMYVYYFGSRLLPGQKIAKKYDVIMFGRFRKYSGVEEFTKLIREVGSLKFLFVGSSVPLGLEENGNVTVIRKYVSDADLMKLIQASRAVVLPYSSASQSGAVPLAISLGVNVVGYDVGGLKEQFFGVKTFLVPPNSGLVKAIEQAVATGGPGPEEIKRWNKKRLDINTNNFKDGWAG